MLKMKKILIMIVSGIVSLSILATSVITASYTKNGQIQSWYASLYLYDFDYSASITYNGPGDGRITYANDMQFSNKVCNNSLAIGTFGCSIRVGQKSKTIAPEKGKVTYVVNVDVSVKNGIGVDIYMGTNQHIIEVFSPGPYRFVDSKLNEIQIVETKSHSFYDLEVAKTYK